MLGRIENKYIKSSTSLVHFGVTIAVGRCEIVAQALIKFSQPMELIGIFLVMNLEKAGSSQSPILSNAFSLILWRICSDGNSARNFSKLAVGGSRRVFHSISRSTVDVSRMTSPTGKRKLDALISIL